MQFLFCLSVKSCNLTEDLVLNHMQRKPVVNMTHWLFDFLFHFDLSDLFQQRHSLKVIDIYSGVGQYHPPHIHFNKFYAI